MAIASELVGGELAKEQLSWQKQKTPTKKRRVTIVTNYGYRGSYDVDLDARWGCGQWERVYLEEGFKEPGTGKVIKPEHIQSIVVTEMDNVIPVGGSLAWLYEQVNETCSYALH